MLNTAEAVANIAVKNLETARGILDRDRHVP